MTEQNEQKEMPKYQCHKQVWALRIVKIEVNTLHFLDGFSAKQMNQEWMDNHKPQIGGFYVVYEDGYESFSPKKAFEGGYKKISN